MTGRGGSVAASGRVLSVLRALLEIAPARAAGAVRDLVVGQMNRQLLLWGGLGLGLLALPPIVAAFFR